MEKADKAMYYAKQRGRNRVVMASSARKPLTDCQRRDAEERRGRRENQHQLGPDVSLD